MEAMFIFNLNFNTVGWYAECEQMRFYGVEGRPAEQALRDMPKVSGAGQLAVTPGGISLVIMAAEQPINHTLPLQLVNTGGQPFTYTITIESDTLDDLMLSDVDGTLEAGETAVVELTISSSGRAAGVYGATLTVSATPGTLDTPAILPVTLYIFDEIYPVYLPAVR
jgi:hypothetical protein